MEGVLKTVLLFVATAIAELVGCYLPYWWLRKDGSPWLLVPAAASLAAFAWLLTFHPTASGRVVRSVLGVYVAMAVFWLWTVDGVRQPWDLLGAASAVGMAIIMFAPRAPVSFVARSLRAGTRLRVPSSSGYWRDGVVGALSGREWLGFPTRRSSEPCSAPWAAPPTA